MNFFVFKWMFAGTLAGFLEDAAGKKRLRTDCFDRKLAGNRFTSVERPRVFHFFQKNPLCIFLDGWCGSIPSDGKHLIPPVLACPNALNAFATCSCKRMNHFRDPCSIFLLFSAEVPARRIYKTNGRISSLICSRELVEK